MGKHAILSASSSHRWLACPPSARLCADKQDKGSEYAQQGTDAHSLCEHKLKLALGMETTDPTGQLAYYDQEMEDCATEYAGYGNLRPSDQQMAVNSKLQRAVDTVAQRESQLEGQLDDEGKKLLSEFSDAQRTVDSITALENFILGFRLGVRIMVECMDRNDGNIRIRGE